MNTKDLIQEHLLETLPKDYTTNIYHSSKTIVIHKNSTTNYTTIFINVEDNTIRIKDSSTSQQHYIDLTHPESLIQLTNIILKYYNPT